MIKYLFSAYFSNSINFQKGYYLIMIIVYEPELNSADKLYSKYIYECIRTKDFTILNEADLDEGIKDVWNFIKELASSAALKIGDLVKALKNKSIFTFFAALDFSPKRFLEAFKGVYDFTKKVAHFIPGTIAKVLQKGYDNISPEHKKIIINGVNAVDKWVKSKGKFGNVLFACFLVWVWLQVGMTGDVAYDFDIAEPLDALRGKLTVSMFFLGDNKDGTNRDGKPVLALEYLGLIITGKLGIGGIIPYAQFGNAIFLIVSIIQYLAKEVGLRINKGKSSDDEINKASLSYF